MLTETPIKHRTATAEIMRVRRGLIEQHFFADTQFSLDAIEANHAVINELSGEEPYVLLSVFPAGLRANPELMNMDHYRDHRSSNALRALAVVTDSQELHTASKLYFLYHQQAFPTQVFEDEFDARAWLAEQLNTGIP